MNEKELRHLLIKVGISANIQGFHYIIKAYDIIKCNKLNINITKIYKMIADEYTTTAGAVERSIRFAVERSYQKSENIKKIYEIKPEVSVFLYDLVFNFDIFQEILEGD